MPDIQGKNSSDKLPGTAANDTIFGQGGNDVLSGRAGNDRILGGPGNDTLEGGPGDDTLIGGAGNDVLKGGPGRDTFILNNRSEENNIKDFNPNEDQKIINGVRQEPGSGNPDNAQSPPLVEVL